MNTSIRQTYQNLQQLRSEIGNKFPGVCLESGAQYRQQNKLTFEIPLLDDFLKGGLPFGKVTELGMPLGKEGRSLLVTLLAHHQTQAQKPFRVLWISCFPGISIYPPAWFIRGVSEKDTIFTYSEKPIVELKRAIIHSFFNMIILDAPRGFTRDDSLFLSTQAKKNKQVIILVRDFFLSNLKGNIWAQLRLNCWRRPHKHEFVIRVVRGLPSGEIRLKESLICSS
ncbi:MAG: hypothetical protein HOC24_12840 [Deltaproteobacteria bacterium]|jgi:hypothetical protein|nr:hypothetical protein [Deltaproteobacteria bacterium]